MNTSLISEIENKLPMPLFVDFVEQIQTDNLNEFVVKKPDLIFYEIGNEEKGENSSDSLAQIAFSIKSMEDYYPVIVVSNCKSSGEALQKLFNYQFITAMPNKLDKSIFHILTDSFIARRASKKIPQDSYYFSPWDNRRSVVVKYNFIVTSLTEHEVTFVSDIELPMFSVLRFKLPLEFYATIVPAYFKMETKGKNYHYMAIIHGMVEDEIKRLRQFVYQIIYKPLEDFDHKTVASILDQVKIGKIPLVKENVEVPVEDMVHEETLHGEEIQTKKLTRNFKFNGKSKL